MQKRLGLKELKVAKISRSEYAAMFGPTTGDQVRLGDTNLWAEVEKDFAVYGDEFYTVAEKLCVTVWA